MITVQQKKGSRGGSRADSRQKKKGKGESSLGGGRESVASGRKSGGDGGDSLRSSQVVEQGDTEGGGREKCDFSGEEEVKVEVPEEGSETWRQAVENLLNGFQNWTHQFSVPCFVSSSAPASELDTVPYRYLSLIPILQTPIPIPTDQRILSMWK